MGEPGGRWWGLWHAASGSPLQSCTSKPSGRNQSGEEVLGDPLRSELKERIGCWTVAAAPTWARGQSGEEVRGDPLRPRRGSTSCWTVAPRGSEGPRVLWWPRHLQPSFTQLQLYCPPFFIRVSADWTHCFRACPSPPLATPAAGKASCRTYFPPLHPVPPSLQAWLPAEPAPEGRVPPVHVERRRAGAAEGD